jgi:hypothetical protein
MRLFVDYTTSLKYPFSYLKMCVDTNTYVLPAFRQRVQKSLCVFDPSVWATRPRSRCSVLEGAVEQQFLSLLRQCPTKWNEYCKRRKEIALRDLPQAVPGRPPKHALAQEAIDLKRSLSYRKVAERLNEKYGPGTTTPGAVRQLIRSRAQEVRLTPL